MQCPVQVAALHKRGPISRFKKQNNNNCGHIVHDMLSLLIPLRIMTSAEIS